MAESKRFLLRLNPDLFETLRRWADDDLRSINAQIEYLLADQARRAGRLPAKRAKPAVDAARSRPSSADVSGGKPSERDERHSERDERPSERDGRARRPGARARA
jgi:hypothetical protein